MPRADHPLSAVLDAAARGRFPPADGAVEVLGPLPGPADAVIGFTAHCYVACDVAPAEVAARVAPGDLSVPMSAAFLGWLGGRIRSRPLTVDALLCTAGTGDGPPDWLRRDTSLDHPRVERASRYRDDMQIWIAEDGVAVLVLGRGVCGRWELGFEVVPDARGAGLGRALARAAAALLPAGTPLWAQVAPGNAASLRAVTAAGFRPVGAEVLFPRTG
jgi:hypothetical protein